MKDPIITEMEYNSSLLSCLENNTLSNASCPGNEIPSSWLEKVSQATERYVFLIIFIFGWINNILSILVLQTKTYRGTSTGFLMTVLAFADIGVVSTSSAQIWIKSLVGYDVRLYSSMGCKWHMLFTYFFIQLSAWILTIITIERLVCVCRPLRVRDIFSLKKTILVWIIVTVLLFGTNLHFLWTMDIFYDEEYDQMCDPHNKFLDNGYWEIWSSIDLVFASAGPFAIIFSCNFVIIILLTRRAAWRRNNSLTGSKESSTTVMLTVNSIAFIILTAPVVIELTWAAYGTYVDDVTGELRFLFFHILFNLNSCLNFVLYSAFSSKFRGAFLLLCCKESAAVRRNNSPIRISGTDMTNTTGSLRTIPESMSDESWHM